MHVFERPIVLKCLLTYVFHDRYEREVNYGHRSAIKKILDGDVSPASAMVLCVCNINSYANPSLIKLDDKINDSNSQGPIGNSATTCPNMKIELTDGW